MDSQYFGDDREAEKVGLTHEVMRRAAYYDLTSHRLTDKDTVLIVMPMFHINAQELIIISILLTDGKMVIAPKFSASKFWPQILENDVTWSSVVPTIVAILLKNKKANAAFRPDHKLRFIRCASAILSVNRQKEFTERYRVPILEGYKMTESCSQCTLNPLDKIKLGSVGKPFGTKVSLLIDNRPRNLSGQIGEVLLKGKNVIISYADRDPNQDFIDGWLKTGDLGYFAADGYLYLTGRSKELINYGGHKISPLKIENVLLQADYVQEAAAVGVTDQMFGEKIVVVVVLNRGTDQATAKKGLIQLLEKNLARFERPQELIFTDHLPHSRVGKILRVQLRQELSK
ncbi:AMP-binding protein [Liquorilactobacillus vini]|uniref:AMP-binding protein n=1 Tax=Liquorilactobacillus vini TaxID=238015 RepID=UPI0022871356|nr:AMP-binding protein [Liquorilactobacillus vini]